MRAWLGMLGLVCSAGCGSVTDHPVDSGPLPDVAEPDGPAELDAAGADAEPPLGPWDAPTNAPGLEGGDVRSASLTGDRLELYFTSELRTGGDGGFDLWKGTRLSTTDPWNVTHVANLSTPSNDASPWVARDGLTLWFSSDRNGANGYDIYVSVRAARSDPWGIAQPVDNLNTVADEVSPSVSDSGLIAVIASNRNGDFDVFISTRTGGMWGTPAPLVEVNSPALDSAFLSYDALELFVTSARAGGAGQRDLYLATRSDDTMPFSTPMNITELNSAGDEEGGWQGMGRRYIFFTRLVPGGTYYEALEARR